MNQSRPIYVIIGVFMVGTLLISNKIFTFPVKIYTIQTQKFEEINSGTKVILYWTPMFDRKDFYLGLGRKMFETCTYNNCLATYNRSILPVNAFDAIIFHGKEYTKERFGAPTQRSSHQIYIFGNMESPSNTPDFSRKFKNFYNWTMTYRLDSDIRRTYGNIVKRKTSYKAPKLKSIRHRPKKIAWFVSNCDTASKREILYSTLKEYIPVDVYGKCGELKCPRQNGSHCYDYISDNYKFYLSFENSLCEDYVTEKMYNILKHNLVPVVYGGANYETLAPPRSVINVLDFKSVKDLAAHLIHLDEHPEEYVKYFDWKKEFVVQSEMQDTICELCKKLHQKIKPKVYKDVGRWWFGENSDMCFQNYVF